MRLYPLIQATKKSATLMDLRDPSDRLFHPLAFLNREDLTEENLPGLASQSDILGWSTDWPAEKRLGKILRGGRRGTLVRVAEIPIWRHWAADGKRLG